MKLIGTLCLLVTAVLSQQLTPYTCGPNNGNQKCPQGTCCSRFGHCGTTTEHCAVYEGCNPFYGSCHPPPQQPPQKPPPPLGRCGPEFGNAQCPDSMCCSVWGYCGMTKEHCEAPNCHSQCRNLQQPMPIPNLMEEEPRYQQQQQIQQIPPPVSPAPVPLQQQALSVRPDMRCGPGIGICAPGLCCSQFGFCGNSPQHCAMPLALKAK